MKDQKKKHLLSLKNKYFAIIYKGCLNNQTAREIHKQLYQATINEKPIYQDKYLLGFAIKLSNKAKKINADSLSLLAIALFDLFSQEKSNDKAKKVINHQVDNNAEQEKLNEFDNFVNISRKNEEWFYLASSHNDCAEDHKPYQGRLYVDNKAPNEIIDYARKHNLLTMQWVTGKPVWFITRPYCRHYFVSLTLEQVENKSLKKLKRKYKTHTAVGNLDLQTPAKRALAEYEDRIKWLRALYREYPSNKLKNEISKTALLIKKWKNEL